MDDEKIMEIYDYISDNCPRSVSQMASMYDVRTNTFIVRYTGEWLIDDRFSLHQFGVEVDFQET